LASPLPEEVSTTLSASARAVRSARFAAPDFRNRAGDVLLDGLFRDPQSGTDLVVTQALDEEGQRRQFLTGWRPADPARRCPLLGRAFSRKRHRPYGW
jgi:hypothetical protein